MTDSLYTLPQAEEEPSQLLYTIPEETTPKLPAEVANQRAQKFSVALGDNSPDPDQMALDIETGRETPYRSMAAQEESLRLRQEKLKILDAISKERGEPATQQDMDFILSLTQDEMSNPETAIEKLYAKAAMGSALLADKNPTLGEALKTSPDQTLDTLDNADAHLAKKEALQRLTEEFEAKASERGIVSKAWDMAETWLPGHTWQNFLDQKENIPEAGGSMSLTRAASILPGGIQERLRDYIMFLPTDEATAEARRIANDLWETNPEDALMFLRNTLQYSTSQQVLENVLIGGADLLEAGAVAKVIAKGVSAYRAAKTTKEVGAKVDEVLAQSADDIKSIEAEVAPTRKPPTPKKPEGMSDEAYANLLKWSGMEPKPESGRADDVIEAITDDATDAAKATPEARARKGVLDTLRGLMGRSSTPDKVLDAAGHTEQASIVGTIKKIRNLMAVKLRGAGGAQGFSELRDQLPMIMDTESWLSRGSKFFSREAQRRMFDEFLTGTPSALKMLATGMRVQRLPESEQAIEAMVMQAKASVQRLYPRLVDTIAEVSPHIEATAAGDVWKAAVWFGDENSHAFKSAQAANLSAQRAGFVDWTVGQRGNGYYYVVSKTVDETDPLIRNLPLETDQITPRSYASTFIAGLRSPEDLLSETARADRKVATGGIGELTALASAASKRLSDLGFSFGKQSRKDLLTFIENDRIHESIIMDQGKEVGREIGRFATTLSEFETRWWDTFGRAPTEKEAIAYMEYVRLNELDWAFRNFRLYRDKARLGMEIFHLDYKTLVNNNTVQLRFSGVEAKGVDDIEWRKDRDAGVLILEEGTPKFIRTSDTVDGASAQAYVQRLKEGNYRILQVSPFGARSLQSERTIKELAGDDTIHYVITKDYKSAPLPLKQLPKKAGGHIEYQQGFFIAQPKVTRVRNDARYDGDTNLLMFSSEAKAKKFAGLYDTVRGMIRNGEREGAIDEFIRANLPHEPEDLKSWFRGRTGTNGEQISEPMLSLEEPIDVRFSGDSLADKLGLRSKYANFVDSREDPYNLYSGVGFEFTGTRNAVIDTIEELGSEARPLVKTKPAHLVDAFSTINRAMRGMFEASFLDDIKYKEASKFIREFGHTLKADPEDLQRNPLKHLFNPQWNENANRLDLMAAKNSLMALRQFVGGETQFAKNLRFVKHRVVDSIYKQFGDKGLESKLVDKLLLYTTRDPLTYARGLAFHTKLGLFNPVQLLLQGQTYFHMAAIAGPKIALQAGPAALFMRGLRFTDDEKIIAHFAQMSTKYGWKKDDFIEAYNELRQTGWDRVGKEVAQLDDALEPQIVKTNAGKFMDWSATFFNEGERFVRVSSYNAAYLEWRAANPLAKLTAKARAQILDRADLFGGNMTRASNAAWQRGFAAIPTQFFAYQARIAEQLLGKRLGKTLAERNMIRARIMGMYSLMYGMPVAAGAGTMFWPWAETVKSELIERGIDYDENILTRGLVDGFASVALEAATGTKYNLGERYGPGGLTGLRDWFLGDKDGMELLVGVSGTVIADMIKAVEPTLGALVDLAKGDNDAFAFVAEDLIDFTKEISTVNNMTKMIYGLNTGKYITKNEMYMSDVNQTEALFIGFTGLSPQKVSDAFHKAQILENQSNAEKEASKEIIKSLRRGLKSENLEDLQRYWKRAKAHMIGAGLDQRAIAKVYRDALDGHTSFIDMIDQRFRESSPERMEQHINEQMKKQ
jgi:hypothetical protein